MTEGQATQWPKEKDKGQATQWPKVNDRWTSNIMAKRKGTEGQAIQ